MKRFPFRYNENLEPIIKNIQAVFGQGYSKNKTLKVALVFLNEMIKNIPKSYCKDGYTKRAYLAKKFNINLWKLRWG